MSTLNPPSEIEDLHEHLVEIGREDAALILTERPPEARENEARFEESRTQINDVLKQAGIEFKVLSGDTCQASRTPTPQ